MVNNPFKPYKTVTFGEWIFKWYYNKKSIRQCYLVISSKNRSFMLRIGGKSYAYGYLLAAATQGKTEQLHGYVSLMYVTAELLTRDQTFAIGVNEEINKWQKRQQEIGAEKAKAVTDEQEQADQTFMEDVAAYADASPKERKKMRKEDKKAMREAIKEDKEDNI